MEYPAPEETNEQFVLRMRNSKFFPEPGKVLESKFWAVLGDIVVGRIALRHHLDENLKEYGGHIGYEVKPSYRRRGVGREMLRLVLQTQECRTIGKILLTCSPDNIGSNKTILANGGVLEKTVFVERINRQTNYYWINLF